MSAPVRYPQLNFNGGEYGTYMYARSDTEQFRRGLKRCENFLLLPQGGLLRRGGGEHVDQLPTIAQDEWVRLVNFDDNSVRQYQIVFTNQRVDFYLNKVLDYTISTDVPWTGAQLANIHWAQSGDSLIVTHPDLPTQIIKHNGGLTQPWTIAAYTFTEQYFFRFNAQQTLTPSATTGSITLTLSGTAGYWKAGYFTGGVQVKVNGGKVTMASPKQDATGGTALSSAGTAANAFDTTTGTSCNAGAYGWIGYNFSNTATRVYTLGLNSNVTGTFTLVYETDDNDTFTSPTQIGSATVSLTAGTVAYTDIPNYVAESRFRIRETGGQTLDMKEVNLSKGLVANGTVVGSPNPSATTADKAWTEQVFGEHKGYARTVTFLGNRIAFCGTRDEPALVVASQDGDIYSFTISSPLVATDAFALRMGASTNIIIRHVVPSRRGLLLFTSGGEYELNNNGAAISAVNGYQIQPQTPYGCSVAPVAEFQGSVLFATKEQKEIRSIAYSFAQDQYLAESNTTAAHHILTDDARPRRIVVLRSYKDTQSNLIFVPRSDGQMAVCTLDSAIKVQGWSRMWTDGEYLDACVTDTVHSNVYGPQPTLYYVVKRLNASDVYEYFLECMTQEEVYADAWFAGTSGSPSSSWGGLQVHAGKWVKVIGDGAVLNDALVDGSGNITTSAPVSAIQAGLQYDSIGETLYLPIDTAEGPLKGGKIQVKRAIMDLDNCYSITVNGYEQVFQNFDVTEYDAALVPFSGQHTAYIDNMGSGYIPNPTVTFSIEEPGAGTVLSMTVLAKVGR